jgi:hypothetical protein
MAGVKRPYYPFDTDRAGEERRLIALGELSEPNTERVFREAGVGPGMRVLDLASGAGDVALLVARLVGPQGSVLGVERSASRERNVVLHEPDVTTCSSSRVTSAHLTMCSRCVSRASMR